MIIGKVSTAMVTPFLENGEVDLKETTRLVNYLLENGSDSLVVCGTTGESPTLSKNEKLSLIEHVVKVVDGRVSVIAGTGSNNTKESIEFTKKAADLGVDGVMLVTPYYNKPSQEGMYHHFKAIAESTTLPVMLYNIPGRSSVNMSAETIVRLSKIPNIVAVKEASGDLGAMTEIIERTEESFALYSGDDGLTLPVLAIGGQGVISVASHVVGNEMQEMIAAFYDGDFKKTQRMHQQLTRFANVLFMAPNPTPVKKALEVIGLPVGGVRLPLVPVSEEEGRIVKKAYETFKSTI